MEAQVRRKFSLRKEGPTEAPFSQHPDNNSAGRVCPAQHKAARE
jgi:hypothetical protein